MMQTSCTFFFLKNIIDRSIKNTAKLKKEKYKQFTAKRPLALESNYQKKNPYNVHFSMQSDLQCMRKNKIFCIILR